MSVLFHISDIDDILAAVAAIPEGVVVRPHPAVTLGKTVIQNGTRIVHWHAAEPGLVEVVPHTDGAGTPFTTRSPVHRGYAIEVDGGRWAIVGVAGSHELYEESLAMVAEVVPL